MKPYDANSLLEDRWARAEHDASLSEPIARAGALRLELVKIGMALYELIGFSEYDQNSLIDTPLWLRTEIERFHGLAAGVQSHVLSAVLELESLSSQLAATYVRLLGASASSLTMAANASEGS